MAAESSSEQGDAKMLRANHKTALAGVGLMCAFLFGSSNVSAQTSLTLEEYLQAGYQIKSINGVGDAHDVWVQGGIDLVKCIIKRQRAGDNMIYFTTEGCYPLLR